MTTETIMAVARRYCAKVERAKTEAGREAIEIFAAREFRRAFDALLKSVRRGGSA